MIAVLRATWANLGSNLVYWGIHDMWRRSVVTIYGQQIAGGWKQQQHVLIPFLWRSSGPVSCFGLGICRILSPGLGEK